MTKFKKFLACAAAVMTLTASVTAVNASAAVVRNTFDGRGDVDNNGVINGQDYTAMLNYKAGKRPYRVTYESVDINDDGKITNLDFMIMSNILLGRDKGSVEVFGGYKFIYPEEVFMDNGIRYAVLRNTGNLEIHERKGRSDEIIFQSHTNYYEDYRNYRLALQTDGNVVVYGIPNYPGATKEEAIWDSGTKIYDGAQRNGKAFYMNFDSNGQFQYYNQDGDLVWQGADLPPEESARKYMKDEDRRKLAEHRINVSNNTPDFHDGYKYSDFEAAAIDFVLYYNETSIEKQSEYGTTIESVNVNGKTKYVINMHPEKGLKGEKRGLYTVPGTGAYMSGTNIVAWVHTHGHEAWVKSGWQNNYFSIESNRDKHGNITAKADVLISQEWGVPAYLGAPNGTMRRYIPGIDSVTSMENTGTLVTYYNGRQVKVPNDAIPEDAKNC